MLRVVAGKYKGRKIKTSKQLDARPTMGIVREAIFNILNARSSVAGSRVIDLFSGSGSLTFEALSRGAKHSFVVDASYNNLQFVKSTALEFGIINDITLVCCSAANLPQSSTKCDLAFIDPPYHSGLVEATLNSLSEKGWLKNGADVVIEVKKGENFDIHKDFKVQLERNYGIARIIFLSYCQSACGLSVQTPENQVTTYENHGN